MTNIASKRDIIDLVSGSKTYAQSYINAYSVGHIGLAFLNPSVSEPTNFVEGDTITINGNLFTFTEEIEEEDQYKIPIASILEETFASVFMALLPYVTKNDDTLNISINSSNNLFYVVPYGKIYLGINHDDIIEGDTLTVGNITYTFKAEPTEENDILLNDLSALRILNSNPDILGCSALMPWLFLLSGSDVTVVSSTSNIEITPTLGRTIVDVQKAVHIFRPSEDYTFAQIPYAGIPGMILTLVNATDGVPVSLVSSFNYYNNTVDFGPGVWEITYINKDYGWAVIKPDGTVEQMFTFLL